MIGRGEIISSGRKEKIIGGMFLSGSEERSFHSQNGEMGIKCKQGEISHSNWNKASFVGSDKCRWI